MDFDTQEDFEFGAELPSDESELAGNGDEGDDYDALNDETFGGPVESVPKDLSDFAANSLILELEDSSLREKHDEPGPSTAFMKQNHGFNWGNASQSQFNTDEQNKAIHAQQEALRNIQALWNPGSSGFGKLSEQMGFPTSFGNMTNVFGGSSVDAPAPIKMEIPEPPFGLQRPRQILTLDEIERQQLMKTGAIINQNDLPSFPRTPGDNVGLNHKDDFVSMMPGAVHMPEPSFPRRSCPPSSSSTADWVRPPSPPAAKLAVLKSAVTAEELERKMIQEYEQKREIPANNTNVPISATVGSIAQAQMPQRFPNPPFPSMPPPPMTPMVLQQMWNQFQQMTLANMSSNNVPIDQIPPWLHSPMPPPTFVAYLMSRMPFPSGVPPPSPMVPPFLPQNANLPCPSTPRANQHSTIVPQMGEVQSQRINRSGCSTPGSTTSSRRTRKDGMPSLRTITDFACDPFAGFMSKKEREWLIKIQLIQCLGTGDKYVDDYYYTMWKQSNQLAKRPADWKQPKIQSKYYNLDETYASSYTPPSFSGALGKPSHATTSFPRQCFKLLDIQAADDDEESIIGGPIRDGKRKLRNILLTIENAYFLQLECDDLRRKLELEPDVSSVIEEKLQSIYTMTMNEANIPTTMLITKGRHLVNRILNMASSHLKIQILANIFNTLRKYSKKVSNMVYDDFIHAAVAAFVEVNINDFNKFFDLTIAGRFKETLNYSSFSQNLFTAFLLACAKRRYQFGEHVLSSSICEYLQSERKIFNGLGNKYYELFTVDEMMILKNWLTHLEIRTPGTVADNILTCVSSKL
uniref:Uncharacterized protein n=1 Tax=Panagrolaimus sp. JU765 TaxID=591449 RepID=A0AC34QDW3_9BILA